MSYSEEDLTLRDKGGSRTGSDRRKLSLVNYSPERRIVKERRSGQDRRNGLRSRDGLAIERRDAFRMVDFKKGRVLNEKELQFIGR
jgi:hypothetical protein